MSTTTFLVSCICLNILNDTGDIASALVPSTVINAFATPTLLSVLGNRIFFNLKEAAEHGVNVGTNWASYSHSAIQFDVPQNHENGCADLVFVLLFSDIDNLTRA